MLRDAMARQNGLGKEARKRMDAGDLVSDATVNSIVAERIVREDCGTGFILDGYPADGSPGGNVPAASEANRSLFVIEIRAEHSNILGRLVSRLMCPGCGEIYNSVSRMPRQDGSCDRCEEGAGAPVR